MWRCRGDNGFVTAADGTRPDWFWTGCKPEAGAPGMQPDGTITSLPLPNVSTCTRQQVLDYFDNTWLITEIVFSSLQGATCASLRSSRVARNSTVRSFLRTAMNIGRSHVVSKAFPTQNVRHLTHYFRFLSFPAYAPETSSQDMFQFQDSRNCEQLKISYC